MNETPIFFKRRTRITTHLRVIYFSVISYNRVHHPTIRDGEGIGKKRKRKYRRLKNSL